MAEREFDGFKKTGLDAEVEQQLAEHCERFAIDPLTADTVVSGALSPPVAQAFPRPRGVLQTDVGRAR